MRRTFIILWSAVLLGAFNLFPIKALGGVNPILPAAIHTNSDFYQPLANMGRWVQSQLYGRSWHPSGISAKWQPYTAGQWVWTDCGWYWDSTEPWAWACYHYGSWAFDPADGWLWVPDVKWSPAWVIWRSGGGYIGWAPAAPPDVPIPPGMFAFINISRFLEPVTTATLVLNDTSIFDNTTEIRGSRQEMRDLGSGTDQEITINTGPGIAEVQKAVGQTIKPEPIAEVLRRVLLRSITPPKTLIPKSATPENGLPELPATPQQGLLPVVPQTPGQPVTPDTGPVPDTPAFPSMPSVPNRPSTPSRPATPARPSVPGVPMNPGSP